MSDDEVNKAFVEYASISMDFICKKKSIGKSILIVRFWRTLKREFRNWLAKRLLPTQSGRSNLDLEGDLLNGFGYFHRTIILSYRHPWRFFIMP